MESKGVVKLYRNCVVLVIHKSIVALYRTLVWHLDTPTLGAVSQREQMHVSPFFHGISNLPCPFVRVVLGPTVLSISCLMSMC